MTVGLVPDGLDGERVDAGLARMFGISRARLAELAGSGAVRVDGRPVGKSDRLSAGSLVEVELPSQVDRAAVVPEEVAGIRIVHDDAHIVVVDKPPGVAAHPSLGWTGPSVVGHLAAAGFRISTSGPPERQGIVQRLDVGTSGLMVVAKSEHAYTVLKRAFRGRTVDKVYHALVRGHPDPFRGTIEAPIGRHPGRDWKMAIRADGRHAVTHYDMLEAFRGVTLMRVQLETGRTHQIRVHFQAVGHPLVGDPTYGGDPAQSERLGLDRQWLHATELGFLHPGSGDEVRFTSAYPDDLARALDAAAAE